MPGEENWTLIYQPGQELELSWPTGDAEDPPADPLPEVEGECRLHLPTDRRKPYLHPVTTPSGAALTAFEPSDHVWHRGIWFAWKYINGVNYWEETPEAAEDGQTEFVGPEHVTLRPDSARVETTLRYRPPRVAPERAVMHEQRRITLHQPQDHLMVLDWSARFTAAVDLTLDRTPPTEQTPWGGYGGMSWRAARSIVDFRVLNSEGQRDDDAQHAPARWASLYGLADGARQRPVGVTMMDHPDNPRHPSPWKLFRDPGFGYLNPALLLHEPMSLAAGAAMTLSYRLLLHDGEPEPTWIEPLYKAFAHAS